MCNTYIPDHPELERFYARLLKAAEHGWPLLSPADRSVAQVPEIDVNRMFVGGESFIRSPYYTIKTTFSLLILAAKHGQTSVVTSLLQRRDLDVNATDRFGNTALHYAAAFEKLETAKLLLQSKTILVNKARITEEDRGYAHYNMHYTLRKEDKNWKASEPHSECVELWTALHYAVATKNAPLVAEILQHPDADPNALDEQGQTPLHLAAAFGFTDGARLLLETKGTDPDRPACMAYTPLHLAAKEGHADIVATLVERADANRRQSRGMTPLSLAAMNGHLEALRALLAAPGGVDVEAVDTTQSCWRPLHWASWMDHAAVVRQLLVAGADVNAACKDGRASIHLAAHSAHREVLRVLLADPRVNVAQLDFDNGFTALHYACSSGFFKGNDRKRRLGVIRDLFAAGADVRARDRCGRTALFEAARTVEADMVKELIDRADYKIDVFTRDDSGMTALDVAAQAIANRVESGTSLLATLRTSRSWKDRLKI